MIPRLHLSTLSSGRPGGSPHETPQDDAQSRVCADYLRELRKTSFSGEIRTDYGARLVTATDNSIYQILPRAVLFPCSAEDISELFKLAREERFQGLDFTARGGGTGTNGQSLSPGIIIDCSKHMNRILQVDLQEKWVRVQPGVVLDQLNDHLKPFGVFFAPNLSPSNRATLGGMISTDACGKGSRIYGRTSNHILELSFVFQEGSIWQSREISLEQLSELKKQDNIVGRVHRVVDAIVTGKAKLIEKQFPKMSRFLTGYNLARVYSAKRDRFNLNNLLAGSEGTLVTLCEARLKLTPIPKYKHLLVIKYQSFNDALQQARLLLDYEPAAIETIDEKILELARGDAIYHHVRDFIADEEWAPTRAINLVEFSGNDAGKLEQRVRDLCRTISPSPDPSLEGRGIPRRGIPSGQASGYYDTRSPDPALEGSGVPWRGIPSERAAGNNATPPSTDPSLKGSGVPRRGTSCGQASGYYATQDAEEMNHLWDLRKKGAGLLGNTQGNRKPLPFVEDTAVPPENLAAYIAEFTALLDAQGLEYGMYGHVDVGCLHVRPALDMKEPEDEALIRRLSDQVVELVRKYGGTMWAEHGQGFRSEYSPLFFGRELYQDLRKIKEAFDPGNKLNPGKIVTPFSLEDEVLPLESPLRGHFDRQIPPSLRTGYDAALNCNGNGICFNYDPHHVMCPSSKVTRDRIHSPKGRAGMMREWLRQLGLMRQNAEPSREPSKSGDSGNKLDEATHFLRKFRNTRARRRGEYDFSHEVYEAMAGCLACKACAVQCPIHVDVPQFRSRFLELYHTRYLRPLRDYLVAGIEWITPLQARAIRLNNEIMQFYPVRIVLEKIIGLCDVPRISPAPLKEGLRQRHAPAFDHTKLAGLTAGEKERSVILLQDLFTTYYEASLVLEIYDLLRMLGYVVYVPPFRANGKPLHVKGFLSAFRTLAEKNTAYLEKLAQLEIAIIGIEPSMVLTYRDEYPKILDQENLAFRVQLLQEWLTSQLPRLRKLHPQGPSTRLNYRLLGHCHEKTAVFDSQKQWQRIYQAFGLELDLPALGCCGMCGTYGHEIEHYAESKGIYLMSWGEYIPADEETRRSLLATGYSCRTQVKRFDDFKPLHPAQALFRELSRR